VPGIRHAAGDDFNIIYSSGTTGVPKGIVQTHAARLHFAFSNAIELGITAEARTLTTTSLYSNGTWIVMLPTLFAGGTLHVMPQFGPDAFLEQVQRHAITHSFMVPAQFIAVLDEPALPDADLSSLHRVLCAGSPLRRDTKRAVLERITPGLVELYGFSEGFAAMLKPHEHAAKFDTVGTPVMGFDLRVIDAEGRPCPPGQPGEIVGYGAGMLREYNARPDLTAELIWRDEHGRSFIRSGDIGMLDEDGYLTIIDRKKDMIISGGFNVFPTDVEAVVGGHPDVSDVTVIGVPHPKWGESCLALVIPRAGAAPAAEAIRDWANERLAKHQRLAAVELRAEFPRNALGKVLKRQLREPYWRDAS
jgi:acyl-CoA synthetase (AMP-forming)/AMP-acid ligase II